MSSFDRFKSLNFTPLDDYQRKGNVLRGAFADLPNTQNRSWINQALPELIWVALLRNQLDIGEFIDALRPVAMRLSQLDITDVTLTGITQAQDDCKEAAIAFVTSSPFLRETLRPLLMFGEHLPDAHIWKNHINMEPDYAEDAALLAETVARVLDHQSQEATDCRWFRLVALILGDRIRMPGDTLEEILSYPNVADMRKTRPTIRALEISCDGLTGGDNAPTQWCDDFWTICFSSTECLIPPPPAGSDPYSLDDYSEFISFQGQKLDAIRSLKETHLPNIKLDVLTGAGLFALKILQELINSPASSGILGRSAVRTLVELAINITFLEEKDDDATWSNFYFHGQGEAKKIFLKYMRTQDRPAFVEVADLWLIANEAKYMDFLNINLGDWDDANLRNRAIDADLKPFYDHYYDWPSNYVHATWAAIRREVYTPCQNPLHKYHILPASLGSNDYGSVLIEALQLTKLILSNVYETYPDFESHKQIGPGH